MCSKMICSAHTLVVASASQTDLQGWLHVPYLCGPRPLKSHFLAMLLEHTTIGFRLCVHACDVHLAEVAVRIAVGEVARSSGRGRLPRRRPTPLETGPLTSAPLSPRPRPPDSPPTPAGKHITDFVKSKSSGLPCQVCCGAILKEPNRCASNLGAH